MKNLVLTGAAVTACLLSLSSSALSRPKQQLSQVTCECTCRADNLQETKTLAPPGGDLKACGQFDGTTCRNQRDDGGTSLGSLEGCRGVVTAPPAPAPTPKAPRAPAAPR